jgi:hypothetical protein
VPTRHRERGCRNVFPFYLFRGGHDVANEKVINFESKKKQKQEEKQEDPFLVKLPKEITDKLHAMEIHVQNLNHNVDTTLATYSEENEGPLDFTLPLESVLRSFLNISAQMDLQVLPEVLDAHRQIRMDLSVEINEAIQRFTTTKDMPVYSQDLYIGVAFTLLSYIQQHRIFSEVRSYDMAKGEADGDDRTPLN